MAKTAYSEVMKAKGEGTRGGKVIGHTKSGKPIYAPVKQTQGNRPGLRGTETYDQKDHNDARIHHGRAAKDNENKAHQALRNPRNPSPAMQKKYDQHMEQAKLHASAETHHGRQVGGGSSNPTTKLSLHREKTGELFRKHRKTK